MFFFNKKNMFFEFIYFFLFSLFLKNMMKKKFMNMYKYKMWMFLMKNIFISKKSKNASMGNGIGKMFKYCMFLKKNTKFIFLKNININIINLIYIFWLQFFKLIIYLK